ncbi:MAG: glycosyltransferase, partial [Thiotrichales bacterium]|nr:glycosyltransferase [Thiotrichales bacterium]
MKILQISDVFYPRINGVSTSIQTFREEFLQLRHEVTLIAPRYTDTDEQHEHLFRIPARVLPFDPEDRLFKGRHVRKLTESLRDRHFDIVHIETPFAAHYAGLRLARALELPSIETYHTHFEEYFYHYLPFLPRAFLKFAARQFNRRQCNGVDALIVPSQAMLDILIEYGVHKPMRIIPTGMDDHFFTPGDGKAFRDRHGIPQEQPVLMHVGRAAHEKNIDFLLHMVDHLRRQVNDVLLVIAGEGPALNHLKRLSATLNLDNHVRFVGYLDRKTGLLDCYAAGDVFVFASRTETQGLVLLEAMAQNVPVVSTAKLGTVDILAPGKGSIIAEEDISDFSGKVWQLLDDPELYERLRNEARPYARSWSAREMAEK